MCSYLYYSTRKTTIVLSSVNLPSSLQELLNQKWYLFIWIYILYTNLILLICRDIPNWDTTGSICYWFINTPRLIGLMKGGNSMVSSGLQALSLTSLTNSTVRPLWHWIMKQHINRLSTISRPLLHMGLMSYKHVFCGKFSLVGGRSQLGNLSAHSCRLYRLLTVVLTMLTMLEVEGTLPR